MLKKYFTDYLHKIDYLTFHYLKEEVRLFLYNCNDGVWANMDFFNSFALCILDKKIYLFYCISFFFISFEYYKLYSF